jgi:hypothetical protein
MHRAEPAKPHQLGNALCILAIRLHRHRLEGVAHVPRLQQFDRQARVSHRRVKPLRLRSGLQPDPGDLKPERAEPGNQRLPLAGSLVFANDLAAGVNNTHARAFQ